MVENFGCLGVWVMDFVIFLLLLFSSSCHSGMSFSFKVICDVLELNRTREMQTECFSVANETFGIGRS